MASQLREVLNRFADQSVPLSLNRMAREMHIEPSMLHSMIEYWVRKGKLREVSSHGENCTTCGVQDACPFVVALPRYYELVREGDTPSSCSCGSCPT